MLLITDLESCPTGIFAEIIRGKGGNVDVYLANQSACLNNEQVQPAGWLGKLLCGEHDDIRAQYCVPP